MSRRIKDICPRSVVKILFPYDTATSLRDNAVSDGIYFGYSLHHNQFNSVKILLGFLIDQRNS